MPDRHEQPSELLDLLAVCLQVEGSPEQRVRGVLDAVIERGLIETDTLAVTCNVWDPARGRMRRTHYDESLGPRAGAAPSALLRDKEFMMVFSDARQHAIDHEIVQQSKGPFYGTLRDIARELGVDPEKVASFLDQHAIRDYYLAIRLASNLRLASVSTVEMAKGPRLSDASRRLIETLSRVLTETLAEIPDPDEKAPDESALSPAQTGVLRHALAGYSEKQIARRLNRSHHTVHSHLKAIYRHYNVGSRAELLSMHLAGPEDLPPEGDDPPGGLG